MRQGMIGMTIVLALAAQASPAPAHEQTERYIPLGRSPGLSGEVTLIGEIDQADAGERTVTIAVPDGSRTVEVTVRTRIWVDRSRYRRTTLKGDFGDLQVGRRIEVMFDDVERRETAAWIKVVPPEPP